MTQVFAQREFAPLTNPDHMLYSGGFFSDADRRVMDDVRAADPVSLAQDQFVFADARLPELLLRYRARNFPETLTDDEKEQWEEYRFRYLTDSEAGASICLEGFHEDIDQRLADPELSADHRDILEALQSYADDLLA